MAALANLILLAFGLSIVLGGVGYVVARQLDTEKLTPGARVLVWRLARLAAVLPLAFALLFALAPSLSNTVAGLWTPEPAAVQAAPMPVQLTDPDAIIRHADSEEAAAAPAPSIAAAPAPVATGEADGPNLLGAAVAAAGGVLAAIDFSSPLWLLYALGLAWALGRFALRRLALAGLLSTSEEAQGELAALYKRWIKFLGLGEGKTRLRVVDTAITPFVTGFKPVVVLPRGLAEQDGLSAAEMALVHELVHVRRGDELDRYLGELLTVALWFNPAMKTIEARLAHAREMACDAEVLDVIGGRAQRRAYAGALIEAAKAGLGMAPTLSAFGPGNKRNREMRIKAIMSHKNGAGTSRGAAAAALGAFALMAVPAFTATAAAASYMAPKAEVIEEIGQAQDTKIFQRRPAGDTAIQRTINSSPFAALEALESLEALENIDESSIIGNPANWAAIGAYASGASSTLNLNLEDEQGRPIRISVSERDGEQVSLTFTDDEGRVNNLTAHDRDGDAHVRLSYDGQDTPVFEVRAQGDDADLIFTDEVGPVSMQVADRGDDAAMITMTDLNTGGASQLYFEDHEDGQIRAPGAGRIRAVGTDSDGPNSAGNYIVIDHDGGWSTVFHHLDSIGVSRGDRVSAGDVIGSGSLESDREHNYDGIGDINVMDMVNMSIVRTSEVEL